MVHFVLLLWKEKSAGIHFRAYAEHTSGYDVTSGHVTSYDVISSQGRFRDVTSCNPCVMTCSPLLPPKYALSCPEILLWYLDWGYPINNPWTNIEGLQSSCPLGILVKGLRRTFNWFKCLGGFLHLKPTVGCQISNLIFEFSFVEEVAMHIPCKLY